MVILVVWCLIYVVGVKGEVLVGMVCSIYVEFDGCYLFMYLGINGGIDVGFVGCFGYVVVFEGLGLVGWGYYVKNEYIEIDFIVLWLYLVVRMLIELGVRVLLL